MRKFFGIFFTIILSASLFSPPARAAESKDIFPIEDLRYPMFVYEPPVKQRTGDMLIVFTYNKPAKEIIEQWKLAAKKNGFDLLAAQPELKDGEQPTFIDKWVRNLQREMIVRYNVKHLYLLGYGDRAHYVSYYGLEHPRDFIGYAAIDGSWVGPFQKITKPKTSKKKQAPFFMAIPKDGTELEPAQNYSKELTAKGYDVKFVVLESVGEASSDSFLNELFTWLKEQRTKREDLVKARPHKTFKEKVSQVIDDFFTV